MTDQQASTARPQPVVVEDLILRQEHQQGFIGAPVVRQGTVAVIMRNGEVEKVIGAGRSLMLRLPFQKVEILYVDTRVRNLTIVSHGEFLTLDYCRVNVSLWFAYQVMDAVRVAVGFAQPVRTLYGTVKDLLGQVINRHDFQTLRQDGRQLVRREVLAARGEVQQLLGIALVDARVDDLTLPERLGTAVDEWQAAGMEGEAEQRRLRGKWQDMPDSVRRSHFQEQMISGQKVFVNPPLPGGMSGYPYVPPAASQVLPPAPGTLPPGGPVIDMPTDRTTLLGGEVWGSLIIVAGPKQGVVFPLRSPRMTVGRNAGNDIVLQDSSVSGQHARIEHLGDQVLIVDMNSSNGTFVNGQRVQQVQLTGGEVILMGSTQFRFEFQR